MSILKGVLRSGECNESMCVDNLDLELRHFTSLNLNLDIVTIDRQGTAILLSWWKEKINIRIINIHIMRVIIFQENF
jgi:hypothetical protein